MMAFTCKTPDAALPATPKHNAAVLKGILTIVGPDGMARFYEEMGGSEVWIPRACGSDHWMSRLFGEEKANEVCQFFNVLDADGKVVGNVRCYVPRPNSRLNALRSKIEEEVKEALLAGTPVLQIVRALGVSERRVREYLRFLRDLGIVERRTSPLSTSMTSGPTSRAGFKHLPTEKIEKIDRLLSKGMSIQSVSKAVGASWVSVTARRNHLAAAGCLTSQTSAPDKDGGPERASASTNVST